MSMLATVEAVRLRGNLSDIDDVNSRVAAALEAATLHLISVLRTTFAQTVHTDQYWIDPQEFPYTDEFIKLFLKQGFVDTGETFEVRFATTLTDLAAATPIDSGYLKITDEEGLLLITGSDRVSPPLIPFQLLGKQFAQVDYTSGFTVTTTEFGPVFDNVPAWLSEAAIMVSLRVYGELCGDKPSSSCLNLQSLLEPYIRYYPSALKPLI